jgi:hypothetical protein
MTDDLTDKVKTVVGILLGLVGTVFSFIGITTGEVTSILRNDPESTPLVALLLLLGVLAAVLTVVINDKGDAASPLDLAAVIVLILGVATVFIWAIPVQRSKQLGWIWGGSKWGWLWGAVICAIAIAALLCRIQRVGRHVYLYKDGQPRPPERRNVSGKVLLIVVSVMLIATGVDAGLRLEQQNQLRTTVQVSASVTDSDPGDTLTVHLTAAKVPNDHWVIFEVSEVDSANPQKILLDVAGGDIYPDVNGDVDNTLEIPLLPGTFGSINISTATCPGPPKSRPPKPPSAHTASPTAATHGNAAAATATSTKPAAGKPSSSGAAPAGKPAGKAASAKAPAVPVDFSVCGIESQLIIANPVPSPTPTATATRASVPSATSSAAPSAVSATHT